MSCSKQGCDKEGVFRPVLLLRVHHNHPPAEAMLDLPLCGEHALEATVDDLVDDAGWAQITAQFAALGRQKPKRKLTAVRLDRALFPTRRE